MTKPMQINHVRISNILGIEELTFDAGSFNEVRGANGLGKTSVLEAVKAALKGGHDATLLRNGATEGEVVLVLDSGQEIIKRVQPGKSDTQIIQDGKKATTRPAEAIKALTDALSVNPVDFLRATKKDRAQVLLESMPIELDAERLTEISGMQIDPNLQAHALHIIDRVRKEVFDQRTGTNGAIKQKKATINQLEATLPPGGVTIPPGSDELIAQLQEIGQAEAAEMDRISTKLNGMTAEANDRIEAIRQDAQTKIDAIKQDAQQQIDAVRADLAETERKANGKRSKEAATFSEKRNAVQSQLANIEQAQQEAGRLKSLQDTIEKMSEELAELEEDAGKQTKALGDIDQMKLDMLGNLPIAGVYVEDGEIYRDGVPFDRLNTAQQVQIAVEVAKLRAGELGIICVDGLEVLDESTFGAFREAAIESGLQMFVTRVGNDDELTIETN